LLDEQGLTQEALAMDHLNYESATAASKWFNGKAPLPERAARSLDAGFGGTSLGVSWVELLRVQRAADKRDGLDAPGANDIYDVFLASPMTAAVESGTYEQERQAAIAVRETLEGFLDLRVYYAGSSLNFEDDFDVPDLAAEMNFDALRESRYFVLAYTAPQTTPKPSSVWVEAGYALALGRPCLFLVRDTQILPYCLQSLQQVAVGARLPPVLVHHVNSLQRAEIILRRQGKDIFDRLDELSAH